MPYSIETNDGIIIEGIPDEVPQDSQQLKDRVAQERAKLSQGEERGALEAVSDTAVGAADLIGGGLYEAGKTSLEGLLGMSGAIGGIPAGHASDIAKKSMSRLPDYEMGEDAQELVKILGEKYKEYAPEMVQDFISAYATLPERGGDSTLARTGSPLLATASHMIPSLVEATVGGGGALTGAKSAAKAIPEAIEGVTEAAQKSSIPIVGQSEFDKKVAGLIEEGSSDTVTALYKLTDDGRSVKDATAKSAARQGWSEGVIAPIKQSSKADKSVMSRMLSMAEKVKGNELFGMRNRPSDIAGDTLMERLNVVKKANKIAGKALEPIAKNLSKESFADDALPAFTKFQEGMEESGIILKLNDDGVVVPDFKGSDIEGLSGPESVVKRVVNRINNIDNMTAYNAHQLKKFIDEQVSYGKNAEGLSGTVERQLKSLRFDINAALGERFPEYAQANKQYSETIGALDAFQKVAGNSMNLAGENADKATGTLMRRLMGNAQSRVRLLDAIDEIEGVASQYGVAKPGQKLLEGAVDTEATNNLFLQVLFANELDAMIGPTPRTSLQGVFDQSLVKAGVNAASSNAGMVDAVISGAGAAVDAVSGVNEKSAIKAMKELLNQGK